jgi:putative transposase
MVLAIKNMGGESEAAWRAVLDDLTARGMAKPELVIVDGGKGLEAALASLWDDMAVQRCTVHKERNLLAHAPKHLHDEIKAEFNDMMHAGNAEDVLGQRKAFLAKWRLRCRAVADSLDEAGERLFTFLRYPPEQWRSLRTTNAIERLHEEFKRRIKTQCLLPCAETAAMLFWALLASGQITMRRVDGWQTLERSPTDLDLAA